MLSTVLALFKLHWAWLKFVLLGVAVILAVLTVSQTVDYLTAWNARRSLRSEQTKASAAHAQQQAASAARYAKYQRDSAALAAQKQFIEAQLTLLERRDDSLTKVRPAYVPLPVSPPRQ